MDGVPLYGLFRGVCEGHTQICQNNGQLIGELTSVGNGHLMPRFRKQSNGNELGFNIRYAKLLGEAFYLTIKVIKHRYSIRCCGEFRVKVK